ncbi:hypothetical protein [Halobellus ruber]|nr:hypothetical protein [Halobellus ruber]
MIAGDEYTFEVVDAVEVGDIVPVSATDCEVAAEDERPSWT